jgi:transposase, IS30 family
LSQWKKEGLSNKECAGRLSRSASTIGRELKRNKTRVAIGNDDWDVVYEPLHAQAVAEERKKNAWNAKQPLKNKKVYAYVIEHLRQGWSPEQIAGRLKHVEYPSDSSWHICHETIYQFIYKEKTDKTKQGILQSRILDKRLSTGKLGATVTDHEKPLWEYLRRKQVRRRKRSGRKIHRVRIPDRVSIHNRPKEVEERNTFGHWEGDSLVGKGHMSGLHTEYERLSSSIRFELMGKINAQSFVNAAKKIFGVLPEKARRSTTLDNGKEHVRHTEIKDEYGMDTYFADPYSAWQRGGNENANMWIRYYFPKGTDFGIITEEELKDVEWELNNRPRKRLKFRTPQEVFTEYLNLP